MVIGSSNPTLIPGYVKGADGPGVTAENARL